jgi:thiol-disulfide isomerase/thioredoxin
MKPALYLAFVLAPAAFGMANNLDGRWDGTIQFDDYKIFFPIEFSGEGSNVKVAFFNGDERVTSTAGKLDGNTLSVRFEHYATQLDATLTDGVLKGTYGGKRNGFHDIEARPHHDAPVISANVPDIAGLWDIPNESPKGEHAWRLIVRQKGPEASAAILRVDGDTGAIVGSYGDGKFVLNHFDGARAYVLEIAPQQDGTLALSLRSGHSAARNYIAVRTVEARAKGIPEPTDPEKHTRMTDQNEPFQFSFPDINGERVSSTDPRFRNKVVIVTITGSWCPNCHDEAPFLVELYRRYHALGLEIVALDFEEPEQLTDKTRLRAFIKEYGIEYTYLIGGEPKELQAKITQAENLNSWPTTFFLGRDGKVRLIHAGFAAPASGEFHTRLQREVTETVERLLAEHSVIPEAAALR